MNFTSAIKKFTIVNGILSVSSISPIACSATLKYFKYFLRHSGRDNVS